MPIELKRGMGSSTTDRENLQHLQRKRLLSSRRDAAAAALNDHRNLAAFDTCAAVSARARGAPIPGSSRRSATCSSRLVGAAAAGDVVIFVLAKLLIRKFWFGADVGVQAVDADVGFAGSGRRRWCRSS